MQLQMRAPFSSWRTCRSVCRANRSRELTPTCGNAVLTTATTNGVDAATVVAYYTDIKGDRLVPEVVVGSLGALPPPAAAFGVEAEGSMTFGTFFAGIAGFTGLTTGARATAVTGTAPGSARQQRTAASSH